MMLVLNERNAAAVLDAMALHSPEDIDAVEDALENLAESPWLFELEDDGSRSFVFRVQGTTWVVRWAYFAVDPTSIVVGMIFALE